ncbi:sensor histidine kinase [Dyadobacter sp. OTU695]|uniref:sensor histidine kinase n=1 Tax=Dyadobacter sp. OTU695 TaxID=3043860 RepID=UPI00313EC588
MNPIDALVSNLISSKIGVHVFFCLAFTAIFSIPVLLSGNDGIGFAAICCCLYILLCTYLGRWFGKLLVKKQMHTTTLLRAFAAFSAWTVLGSVGAGTMFRGEPVKHFLEYLAISFPLVILFAFLGFSIALVRNSLTRQINEAKLQQQQQESELRLLLSQLSPHFLFNTLNNIYGLSITEHSRVPGLLLKLSELLRYSIYETKASFIPIKSEIAYIRNYILFERIQTDQKISFNEQIAEVTDSNLLIAPMLLIVFVENAFKHSRHARSSNVSISVQLNLDHDWLFFEVCNTCVPSGGANVGLLDSSGIGLAHTIRRLDLIYPGNYSYQVQKCNEEYRMKLGVKIVTR